MSSRITRQVQPGGAGNTYVWGVMLSGGTLYATDMMSGFWALDPITLATKGGGNNVPERYGSDQWVYGQYAYSGTWGTRGVPGNAVKIWALDASGVPTLADSIIVPNVTTISDVAVTPDGKMLVFTAEGGAGQGLYVYNRTNPPKPVLAGSYQRRQGEHTGEVAVINGRTYVFAARVRACSRWTFSTSPASCRNPLRRGRQCTLLRGDRLVAPLPHPSQSSSCIVASFR